MEKLLQCHCMLVPKKKKKVLPGSMQTKVAWCRFTDMRRYLQPELLSRGPVALPLTPRSSCCHSFSLPWKKTKKTKNPADFTTLHHFLRFFLERSFCPVAKKVKERKRGSSRITMHSLRQHLLLIPHRNGVLHYLGFCARVGFIFRLNYLGLFSWAAACNLHFVQRCDELLGMGECGSEMFIMGWTRKKSERGGWGRRDWGGVKAKVKAKDEFEKETATSSGCI